MTECAWCATRTKGTYFSARYKRLAARRGKKRALVAIAAEMLKVVYHMLKDGSVYQELGEDYMVSRHKDAQIKNSTNYSERIRPRQKAHRRTNPKAAFYWDFEPD